MQADFEHVKGNVEKVMKDTGRVVHSGQDISSTLREQSSELQVCTNTIP